MRRITTVACTLVLAAPLAAQEPVDYLRDVKPILQERCFACHGALKQKGRLRLDTAAAARRGGKNGPAFVPGQPDKSLLLERITASEASERMPPEGKPLTGAQIALLRRWIQQGAPSPIAERAEDDPRRHWAFQRPERPSVPGVKNFAWVRNPIDAFVAAVHEQKGVTPAPAADRATLLRRVYLDLIGLPPTPAELHAFLADPAPDAYEKVVDRLLSSPRHAERWARHWMDIWRYSDWYGSRFINELRNSRRHIWRWRDWLIEALDRDLGYDRMILEMLAADELTPGDAAVQRASGYLGRNFYVFNRNVWLQDTVEYTASAILGLTMKCCRCHDHKYDPITQEEYYRLRAFFEPHQVRTDPLPGKTAPLKANLAANSPGGTNLKDGLDCVYDGAVVPTYLFLRGNDKDPATDRPLQPGVPAILGGAVTVAAVSLPVEAFYPMLRPEHVREQRRLVQAAVPAAEAESGKAPDAPSKAVAAQRVALARATLAALDARIAADRGKFSASIPDAAKQALYLAASKAERDEAVCQAELDLAQARQQAASAKSAKTAASIVQIQIRLAQAQKTALEASSRYTPLGPVYPSASTGRRLALARWITGRDNPLTARVAVNHLWLRHFGAALVPSVQNFGRNGKPPTHPQLLDWLAVELMERNWSMKAIHRLIVTSNAYRMASHHAERDVYGKVDSENRYLWRANVRRMEAEVVRDSLLHLAGRLDLCRGGEDLDPTLADKLPRRSLYFRHTPDEKPLLLELFDAANPSECFERTESIVPQQALALVNGDFSHSQARLMARRLDANLPARKDAEFIAAAFELVMSRQPLAQEMTSCESFLREQAVRLGNAKALTPDPNATVASAVPPSPDPRLRVRENLVHVLLNYNEYATIR